MIHRDRIIRSLLVIAASTAMIAVPATARAELLGIMVPSYFYPGTGGPGGSGDGWAAMAAAAGQVPITAILNPASGPATVVDPNYVAAMTNLENAGGTVVAYVYTGNGSIPLATVESQINTYISQYGGLINGFFLDGMSILPSTLSHYQAINSYIKSLSSSYTVIGNPGHPFLNGVPPAEYLSTADIFNIYEGAGGFGDFPFDQTWYQSYPASRFSSIIHDVASDAGSPQESSAMLGVVSQAVSLNFGLIYVSDDTLPNPFDQLPSYWDQEVGAVAAVNLVPEPSTSVIMAAAVLLSAVRLVPWRRLPLPLRPARLRTP